MTPILLPLYVGPSVDPAAWQAAAAGAGELTVVAGGPDDPELADAVGWLARSGVATLGRVDAAFATRPVADLLDEVQGWSSCPVSGVFIDQAPTSPFCLGPVALAVRLARRAGLFTVVLNPGVPTDPLYRELDVAVCTFEGPWLEYRRWSGDGSQPGDGHLVHSVPVESMAAARALVRQRGAGWGLVSDRTPPSPYGGIPAWLSHRAVLGDPVSRGPDGTGV